MTLRENIQTLMRPNRLGLYITPTESLQSLPVTSILDLPLLLSSF